MKLECVVEEIVYRNEENSYTVAIVKSDNNLITAVGKFPIITQGECLECQGSFSAHPKYGEQFAVTDIKIKQPTTCAGIIKYLSSGLIKGVGIITAQNIVGYFGESTLDVIEFNFSRLSEVRGISDKKAVEIYESYSQVKKMQNAILVMQEHNISTNLAIKIYNTYKDDTENILQNNPYKLVEDIDGVGFLTADKIAQSLGISYTSTFRFRAGILHTIKDNTDKNGNTYITKSNLEHLVTELLRIKVQNYMQIFESVLENLINDNALVQLQKDDDTIYVLQKFYLIEKAIATRLRLFTANEYNVKRDLSSEIEIYEKFNKISMHENQKLAVQMAVNNGVSIITGGPGTGKTTIIKCAMQLFKQLGKKVKLLAPTGRAAKRMSESCNTDASTIHRGLEVEFGTSHMFRYNLMNKLPYDVVIVDEVSMVDVQLFNSLLLALKNTCQLVLVGDKDQLPSVGAGNVLSDLLESQVIPNVCLTQIFRQSENSLIITNAHAINNGQMPIIDNKSSDFFVQIKEDSFDTMNTVIDMTIKRIPNFLKVSVDNIQVLAPMRNGNCGIDNLNQQLQQKINPPSLNKNEVVLDKITYRVGDRIMQTSNNYERIWNKDGVEGTGVFNGDIGKIIEVNNQTSETIVAFEDGRVARYVKGDLNEITLSYAITIHKSQGSEFDVVIIPIVGGPPMLTSRNLLYTGVTRAKRMVVLVGSLAVIKRMVKNNHTQKKFTLLKDFLLIEEEML